jgi:hypothetical protein
MIGSALIGIPEHSEKTAAMNQQYRRSTINH